MKYLFLLFSILSSPAFTQNSTVFYLDSLPQQGVLLNKGWKYQTGDNPEWAKPDFDAAAWTAIDPTKDIVALPEIFDAQIKWLRLDFEITKPLPGLLGIAISQAGASEIYLNGHLVREYGNFDTDPGKVKAYDPLQTLIHLPADSVGKYHLAVRYALQPHIRYTHVFGLTKNYLFHATLFDLVPAQHAQMEFKVYYKGIDIFILGVVFMLFVLHLAFYIYQTSNKSYLILACYLLCSTLMRVFKLIGQSQNLVEDRYYSLNIANWLLGITFIFVATVYYRIVKKRFDKYYYVIVVYFIVYGFVSSFVYGFNYQNIPLLFGTIYSFIVLVRLIRYGIQKGIKGFFTLGFSTFFAVIGLLCITLAMRFLNYGLAPTGYNVLNYGISPYFIDAVFNFASIAIPIGLSLFMGIQVNETHKALSRQLIENEVLKNKAIDHEQEKQLLLANQNEILEKQVAERTTELNQSLETLKSTQTQLIQSEKLASLGELTAGIAHEIQNPLNFVKNFSELSVGIAKDLNEEMNRPELDKAYIEELLYDLTQNQQKINHHGNRASSIVTGMLHHARASTGKKEPTDINALADEYLRLSFHGLRAKDSNFKSKMVTDFDPTIGQVDVVPQDIGRVFLNLINNAFYAVNERMKHQLPESFKLSGSYEPTVTISTQKIDNQIIIKIKDNGTGIPEAVKAKIFQPFFTTKASGQGTGLGLSLSYDIIVKGHGGTLEVESAEGVGSVFIIQMPIL